MMRFLSVSATAEVAKNIVMIEQQSANDAKYTNGCKIAFNTGKLDAAKEMTRIPLCIGFLYANFTMMPAKIAKNKLPIIVL